MSNSTWRKDVELLELAGFIKVLGGPGESPPPGRRSRPGQRYYPGPRYSRLLAGQLTERRLVDEIRQALALRAIEAAARAKEALGLARAAGVALQKSVGIPSFLSRLVLTVLKERDSARAREPKAERHSRHGPDPPLEPPPGGRAPQSAAGWPRSFAKAQQGRQRRAVCPTPRLSIGDLWRGMVRWRLIRAMLRSDLSNA